MHSAAPDGDVSAVLFPGQGSQTDSMRATAERYEPELVAAADAALGRDAFAAAASDTACAQPALYCAGLACWRRLGRPQPSYMAGHSLGEITALAAAGSISPLDGLRLVIARGRLMQDAFEGGPACGMLAVMARDRAAVARVAGATGVAVANDNAPQQLVLSGDAAALDEAATALGAEGMRSMRLPVAGAFHSPIMGPAAVGYANAVAEVDFAPPCVPVLSCASAEPFDDIPARLVESLTSAVRWREVLLRLRSLGATRFVETGPGRVLTGLVRRTLPDADAVAGEKLPAADAQPA